MSEFIWLIASFGVGLAVGQFIGDRQGFKFGKQIGFMEAQIKQLEQEERDDHDRAR